MSENRFTCGPFTLGDQDALLGALESLGLRLSDDGVLPRCAPEPSGGLRLEARGEGVRGYLLAEDGEEAELQDVRRLVLCCCLPGREVKFHGSALIAGEKVLVISSTAVHDGRRVTWESKRTLLGPSGKPVILRDRIG